MGKKSKFSEGLLNKLQDLQKSGTFCDFTVSVGGKKYTCHKVILGALSGYFSAMLSSGMSECENNASDLPFMDTDTFEALLEFFYLGKDIVTIDNVEDILEAATFLQIECLQSRCEELITETLTLDTSIHWWKFARSRNYKTLEEKGLTFILNNFRDLSQADDFMTLEKDELITIVQNDKLASPNEEFVCDTVCHWIRHDLEDRKQYIGDTFDELKLPLTSGAYVMSIVTLYPFLKDDEDAMRFINEATRYHLISESRQDFSTKRVEPRCGTDYEQVLMVIGGTTDTNSQCKTTTNVCCFSFRRKQWFSLEQLPYDPEMDFATCVLDECTLFVSGGCSGNKSSGKMLKYSAHSNKWIRCRHMKQTRRRHAMITIGNTVHVLGGYDDEGSRTLDTIECFFTEMNEWKTIGKLLTPLESITAAAVTNKIYIFGGNDGSKVVAQVQCFDTGLRTTTHICDLPFPRCLMQTVRIDSRVLIVTTTGKVLELVDEEQVKEVAEIKAADKSYFAIVQHRAKLVILGGEGNDGDLCDDMITYNVHNGEEEILEQKLPHPLSAFGTAKISVRKVYLASLW